MDVFEELKDYAKMLGYTGSPRNLPDILWHAQCLGFVKPGTDNYMYYQLSLLNNEEFSKAVDSKVFQCGTRLYIKK